MKLRSTIMAVLLVATLWPGGLHGAQPSQERQPGSLRFEPFEYKIEGQTVEAELGRLVVRENRSNPTSNLIELAFVRLKSTAPQPGPPIIYLEGGPGASAIGGARFPDYMRAFTKLRETGDVILLDQRGVGYSRPNLTRPSLPLPLNFFVDQKQALDVIKERSREAARSFVEQGVDLRAYNTVESADDVDDLRKALGAARVNLVGFSYGTHLALAVIRRHPEHVNRAALIGTEGPNHTEKLPSTSQRQIEKISKLVAADPSVGKKVPDLTGLLKRVLERLEKQPATIRITDRRSNRAVAVQVGKFGLQLILMIDLGDTSDLPIFPALLYTLDKGDYSILAGFVEKRYNQLNAGIPVMMEVMDAASGATRERRAQISREAQHSLLDNVMNFLDVGEVFGKPDLGDEYRSAIRTGVPTLFISGSLDNNTPPGQADEVRKRFKSSAHIIVKNAGHEDMLINPQVQQAIADYFGGRDISRVKIALPALRFLPIPDIKAGDQ
ncbi:MAG: alpha/beta fold hydrolase [Blastocatellia bacterium]